MDLKTSLSERSRIGSHFKMIWDQLQNGYNLFNSFINVTQYDNVGRIYVVFTK